MKFIFSRRVFASCFFVGVFALITTKLFAREIVYQTKDYSSIAHKLIGDEGKNALYMVPIYDVSKHLFMKFDIKRTSLWVVNNHVVPGKSLIKTARLLVFNTKGDYQVIKAQELFRSLREGVPHTYVITKDHLIFIESTKTPITERCKDRFSKHYIISGLQKSVRFAGEFYVYQSPHQEVFAVFDNASGTYRPDSRILPNLKELLDSNLSDDGLQLVVKSFDQKVDEQRMLAGENNFLIKQKL